MIGVKENQEVYFSSFSLFDKRLGTGQPAWLRRIRQAALDHFAELGFPTTRQEAWRFTNVAPLATTPFQLADRQEVTAGLAEKFTHLPFADLECSRLVFVNGHFSRELSSPEVLAQGIKACSLAEAVASNVPAVEQNLARYASYKDHALVALNTAFLADGAFVEIPKRVVLEKPIYLLSISTGGSEPTVSHPRNLVLIGPESQVTIIEGHLGLEGGVYLTNAVSEVVVGENAIVDHCKLQQESESAYHIATLRLQQGRDSTVSAFALTFGAALSRQEVHAVLDGEGSECTLNGLYMATGRQHVDHYTTLDHARPHCNSRELYKGILDGKSAGVFHGRIIVRKGAQKTDAKQSNRNLLLSDDATINTKPQLEIYADDVKCTHGATIGQIEQDAIFYLRSRGISRDEARRLLTYAFANEIIERIKFGPMRDRLRDALFARLGTGKEGA